MLAFPVVDVDLSINSKASQILENAMFFAAPQWWAVEPPSEAMFRMTCNQGLHLDFFHGRAQAEHENIEK